MPEVSIILPVYNVEKYIHHCIESILGQTYKDFELLVIDDGSPDKSVEIARQFHDSRITIFQKPNGGLSDARNYGIQRAGGKYIYLIDSDDWVEPYLLENCLNILERENIDLLIFGYIQDNVDLHGNVISSFSKVPPNETFVKSEQNLRIDSHLLGILGYAWNKIYRRDFIVSNSLKFEKGISLVEDILFNTQVYCKTKSIRMLDKAYYHYINRPDTTLIKQYHSNSFELKIRKTKALEMFLNDWDINPSNKNEVLSFSLVGGIRYCIHNLFSYKNNLLFSEKLSYIKKMVSNKTTLQLIKNYKPKFIKDRIYKFLIKYRAHRAIALLSYLMK